MLANAIAAVEAGSPGLRRVLLLEGAKAYGVHLGPFKVPALESDSRHMPPNFYYAQEDLLRDLSAEREWDFTVLRPDVVCGKATGVPYNLALLLAVYAIVCRELGLQLKFPGKPATWHQFAQVTDSRLLAQALEWAATEPRCHDQVINITNGDLFQWEHLWPHIAAHFDLAVGTPQPLRLAEVMRDKASLWKDIVGRHGLVDIDFEQLVNWDFGDWVWDCDFPVVSDTLKARELGFNGFVRSTEMFTRIFDELSSSHVIPSSRSLSDPNNSNQSAVQLLTKSLEKSE
jgi:nucleoside-diphosphate-sugar epimerase